MYKATEYPLSEENGESSQCSVKFTTFSLFLGKPQFNASPISIGRHSSEFAIPIIQSRSAGHVSRPGWLLLPLLIHTRALSSSLLAFIY